MVVINIIKVYRENEGQYIQVVRDGSKGSGVFIAETQKVDVNTMTVLKNGKIGRTEFVK